MTDPIIEAKKVIMVGVKFRYDNYLYHVLGIFDEENVAVKYYGKHKQYWNYEFMDMYFIGLGLIDKRIVITA